MCVCVCGQEDLARFRRAAAAEHVRAPECVMGGAELALNPHVSLESLKISRKNRTLFALVEG